MEYTDDSEEFIKGGTSLDPNLGVKYVGPFRDYSGYGEATRNFIKAMDVAGVPLITECVNNFSHQNKDLDLGGAFESCLKHEGRGINYFAKVLHVTPDLYHKYLEPGKYHIGHFFWETEYIPEEWVWNLKKMDEIWTDSKAMARVLNDHGIYMPIRAFPQAIDVDQGEYKPFNNDLSSYFKFYAIFEWTERKDPVSLLKGFWQAFEGVTDVCLLVKSYLNGFKPAQMDVLANRMREIRNELKLSHYAPVFLVPDLLTRQGMMRFHATGDCFVSTHRGEGWGIPQMEAMLTGNPVVSTNIGGIHNYMDNTNSFKLKFDMVTINQTQNRWYKQGTRWGQVDMEHYIKNLRYIYDKNNRKHVEELANNGKQTVLNLFNYKKVGTDIRHRLMQIHSDWIDGKEFFI